MQLEIIDRFSSDLDEIAARSPQATFYHSAAWIESLIDVYPRLEFRCIVARSDSQVVGYLPFFVHKRRFAGVYSSLPFGTYGGPAGPHGESVTDSLAREFVEMRHKRGVHEVTLVDFHNEVRTPDLRREVNVTHILPLQEGFDSIWANRYDKAKRRQTRRAEREGIRVVEADGIDDVKRYYRIYEEKCREWRQRLTYPEALFTQLFSRGTGNVKLFLAYADDKILGGHLNFYFRDSVIAWNGVTSNDSRSVQASTLLYSTCIRHACEKGYRYYNLGSSLGKTSLMDYKESLGGEIYRYQTVRWRSLTVKIAAAARKYLPGR